MTLSKVVRPRMVLLNRNGTSKNSELKEQWSYAPNVNVILLFIFVLLMIHHRHNFLENNRDVCITFPFSVLEKDT